MSVTHFTITDEEVALHLSTEREKTVRHIDYFSSPNSVKKIQVGICLLLVELCERFTFFEVVCNMIPFCTVKLGYHNYQAAILNLCFIGTSILTPVLVGWLADIFLGRNKLVYICLFLHFLGTALLSGVAFPSEDSYIGSYHVINHIPTKEQNRLFHVALLAISLGTGGIRAIVCPQAAYGLQEHKSKKRTSLFNCCETFNEMCHCIRTTQRFPAIMLSSLDWKSQALKAPLPSKAAKCCSLLATFGVFVNALKTCCLQYFHLGRDVTDWLDHAKEKNGGHYSELLVEDTKPFFALLPLFIFQLIYRVCIMQIPSAYYLQTMNSNLNLDGFLLPIAVMNAISSLPLLVLAPFMEYFSTCLFPSKRDGPFLSACIIAGNLSAALSVMVAGFSEIRRKHFPLLEQPLLGQVLPVSSMPCFHLVLQYVLLGVAETLVNPALSIIAHRFVPRTVRGTSMNFLTLFNGFGCFTGALLVELVYLISEGNWFPNTLNKGNLESFFFLLASLTLLNVLGFWSVSQRYCNLNHFNAQNISGSNLEETLLLHEKSLKFYGSTQEISSSIDLWETAL
ncbi:solute carrier family 15 member 5 [Ictidomys tridecemlineatus]|uniref:solute carrier family 15 member 5 n=1 Tax=Ictidomys tridecemlineatus TaxID=43179 RepID=UPI00038C48A9|nr:solute carrier family 15 member 5 [Ictidomys tridecemlineatus]KAG3292310.1 solute carrier family 15 member 5 [Ictidomys tridecemlineatus]